MVTATFARKDVLFASSGIGMQNKNTVKLVLIAGRVAKYAAAICLGAEHEDNTRGKRSEQ